MRNRFEATNSGADADSASDESLMLLVKEGDVGAFDILVERYRESLFAFLYRFLGNRSLAEDLFQESFLRLFRAAPRYEPRAKFSTFLYRIATNLAINLVRKRRDYLHRSLEAPVGSSEESPLLGDLLAGSAADPEQQALVAQRRQLVRQALDQLSPPYRAVIALAEYEGRPYEEIAVTLGCSVGTVKSRVHRAKKMMLKFLEGYEL
jgi:RNA polymerase sigma-70 factor, ECF subfamily